MAGYQNKIQFAIDTKNQVREFLEEKNIKISENDSFRNYITKLIDYLSSSSDPGSTENLIFSEKCFTARSLEDMKKYPPKRWWELVDIAPDMDWTKFCEFYPSCASKLPTILSYAYYKGSEVYLKGFDVTTFTGDFKIFCYSSVNKVDFTGMKGTENLTNLNRLFYACTRLKEVVFGDDFNTDNVTDIDSMFYQASEIMHIQFPNNWLSNPSITNVNSSRFDSLHKLDRESVIDLVNKISDKSDTSIYSGTYSVSLSSAVKKRFTEEEIASIAAQFNAKNWTLTWY